MQIKIEIDVRPEELRRFVGLPDVAGLQDDLIEFVRGKLGQASENFDAGTFVKNNLKLLSRSPILGKLIASAMLKPEGEDANQADGQSEAAAAPKPAAAARNPGRARSAKARKPKAARKSAKARKRTRKKPGAEAPAS